MVVFLVGGQKRKRKSPTKHEDLCTFPILVSKEVEVLEEKHSIHFRPFSRCLLNRCKGNLNLSYSLSQELLSHRVVTFRPEVRLKEQMTSLKCEKEQRARKVSQTKTELDLKSVQQSPPPKVSSFALRRNTVEATHTSSQRRLMADQEKEAEKRCCPSVGSPNSVYSTSR